MWIQFSNCQIFPTQLIINLNVIAIIFPTSHVIQLRLTKVKPMERDSILLSK